MREIKFRAWHKTGEAMMPDLKNIYTLNSAFQNDNLIFMQFTGLTDKNGVDIYEGDIVEGTCLGFCDEDKFKDFVEFSNSSFCFSREKWKDGTYDWSTLENYDSEDLLVVGNIYEGATTKVAK